MNASCHTWTSHVTHMHQGERICVSLDLDWTCHVTYERVMSHTCSKATEYEWASTSIGASHYAQPTSQRHTRTHTHIHIHTHIRRRRIAGEGVLIFIKMGGMLGGWRCLGGVGRWCNESCHIYMIAESYHMYTWVMSHIYMSHVTHEWVVSHIHESCHM